MNKLSVEDLDLKGQRVLLRVDFNVPLDENRIVKDDTRILAALPTINYLTGKGARVILVSHLGRPKGKSSDELSLRPVAEALENILGQKVFFSPTALGSVAQTAVDCLKDGDVLLLENIRFYPEEEKNDGNFAKELASLADKFVNDAFGAVHRAHASNNGAAIHFEDAACGFLIKREIEYLETLTENTPRPFCAIIGGAKVKDKIKVLHKLIEKADNILLGGGMAYTFLKVQGYKIGNSICDEVSLAQELLNKADAHNTKIYLPVDHVASAKFDSKAEGRIMTGDIEDGYMGMDIGSKTVESYLSVINEAGTIFWNGPMGVFEFPKFAAGSFEIAKGVAAAKGISVIGGGDSIAAVNQSKMADKISHLSTGGGALLQFLEGKKLPGLECLADK